MSPVTVLRHALMVIMLSVFTWVCVRSTRKLLAGGVATAEGFVFEDADWPDVTTCSIVIADKSNLTFDQVMRSVPDKDNFITEFKIENPASNNSAWPALAKWQRRVFVFDSYGFNAYQIRACFTVSPSRKLTPSDTMLINTSRHSADQRIHILHQKNQLVHSLVDAGAMKTIEPVGGIASGKKLFQFFVTKIITLRTTDNPCDESNSQRLSDCVDKRIETTIGCCLPWSASCARSSASDLSAYSCEHRRLHLLSLESLSSATRCAVNCVRMAYSANLMQTLRADNDSVVLVSTQSTVPVKTQMLMYDADSLLADVGGYLGMLVGASVISLFDDLSRLANSIATRISKTRKLQA